MPTEGKSGPLADLVKESAYFDAFLKWLDDRARGAVTGAAYTVHVKPGMKPSEYMKAATGDPASAVAASRTEAELVRRMVAAALLVSSGTDEEVELVRRASDVIGADRVAQWMQTSIPSLGGRTPYSLMSSEEGRSLVQTVLGRIEHGVY